MSQPELTFSTFRKHALKRLFALAYLRVSSPDQAERSASLAEQRRKVDALAERLDMTIVHVYEDEGLSAARDHEARGEFWQMVEHAKSDPAIGAILVDDETRFFRDRYATAQVKGELREHGVVVYTSTRTLDPRTMAGMWQESIEETAAHADNIMRRDATMRGMVGNIRERCPDTGWAFKNGGQAPYGWKNKRIHMGNDSRGRPVGRTIWEIDEEAARVRRQILMWRLERQWSYVRIRDELNRRGIPSARGGIWSHTTIQNIFREDMIWTAAGYSIWNKHYRNSERPASGSKFKPTDEWVIEPNAHPSIITEEEAHGLLAIGKRRRRQWQRTRGNEQRSVYLLSGSRAEDGPLFVCSACGSSMVGNSIGVRGGRARRYICGGYNRHGREFCTPVWVHADEIEQNVITYIRDRLLTEEQIAATIRAANALIEADASTEPDARRLQARINEIERKVERAKRAILAGLDEYEWVETIRGLRAEQQRLREQLEEDVPAPIRQPLNEDDAPEIHRRLTEAFRSSEPDDVRRAIRAFVTRIKLDPAERRVVAEFAPSWAVDSDDPLLAPMWYPQRDSSSALVRRVAVWSAL